MDTFNKILCIGTIVLVVFACSNKVTNKYEYIDDAKPSITPLLFAKNFITKDSVSEFGSVFNKTKDEFYFAIDSDGRSLIKYSMYKNGVWSKPEIVFSDSVHSFNDPFLSNDENRLYYISDLPRNERDTIMDIDIWYSKRVGEKWSCPINAGNEINTDADEYYISFNNEGAMYFASNKGKSSKRQHDFDIYKSAYKNEKFETPQKLSEAINTKAYEADVFISPDESYIIYCSFKRSGLGEGDLYISFKKDNGQWSESVNMGRPINTEGHELCPFVTKDGKYLFYTSNQDIYWVSADIIDMIKERQ